MLEKLLDELRDSAGIESVNEGSMDRYDPSQQFQLVHNAVGVMEKDAKEALRLATAISRQSGGAGSTVDPRGRPLSEQNARNLKMVAERALRAKDDLAFAKKGLAVILKKEKARI